jgi:N,N'-diacetyllegionaminate synthase
MVVSQQESPYIIAEIANTHEGNIKNAKSLVSAIAENADAIKFQMFTADELAVPSFPDYDAYQELQFTREEWTELISFTADQDVDVFADVFGNWGVSIAEQTEISGVKIHTADVSNHALLRSVAALGLPVVISAGGTTALELREATAILEDGDVPEILLMYGFQAYPTQLDDSNLSRIHKLTREWEYPIGYASHVDGGVSEAVDVPVWATAAGAEAVEVHVTEDRSREGTDYYSSLEPDQFLTMVSKLRRCNRALGTDPAKFSEEERAYRSKHKKWAVATKQIDPGTTLTEDHIILRRTPDVPANAFSRIDTLLGQTVSTTIPKHDPLTMTDLDLTTAAVLACRAESTRLYGKPLQQLGDKPILEHQINRLRKVSAVDEIVLAIADTPSKSVFKAFARDHNLPFTVGSEPDVLARLIDGAHHVDADIAIRATTENPYLYWQNIDDLVSVLVDTNADLVTTRMMPPGAYVEVVSVQALERAHEMGEDRHRSELCTTYITENPTDFDIRAVDPPEALARPDIRLTVDNPCDLMVLREIETGIDADGLLSLEAIIDFLDDNPSIRALNETKPDGTDPDVQQHNPHIYGELTDD